MGCCVSVSTEVIHFDKGLYTIRNGSSQNSIHDGAKGVNLSTSIYGDRVYNKIPKYLPWLLPGTF